MTPGARARIQEAEKVLVLTGDPVTTALVRKLNVNAESLNGCYKLGESRIAAYKAMIKLIMRDLRRGKRVCVVDYGHPGFFDYPAHRAIELARREGYSAEMLPGVSALDCLLADLGFDPGDAGCQIHDATEFLIHRRRVDPSTPLILLQIAVTGMFVHTDEAPVAGLQILGRELSKMYEPNHLVVMYTASQYPFAVPQIKRIKIRELPNARPDAVATLFVPPKRKAQFKFAVLKELGITPKTSPRTSSR